MSKLNVVRAWRDAKYRRSLSEAERAILPDNPAGLVELSDDDLRIAGGFAAGGIPPQTTALSCTEYSFRGWRACGCVPETTAPTCTQYTFGGLKGCCP